MSLLSDLIQGVLQEQVVRSGVEAASAGAEIKTSPLFPVRVWGTRGRIGLFYVVDVPKAQKGTAKLPIPAASTSAEPTSHSLPVREGTP